MKTTALALLLLSGTAAADAYVASDGAVPRETARSWDGRLGMLLGGADVGDADGFSVGVSLGGGYRVGDVTLRALLDYYKVGDSSDEMMPRRGRATRVGGALRYSFANTGHDEKGVGFDFWGEAGLGLEHVAWLQGGVLDRASGEAAVGFEITGFGDRDRDGHRRAVGYFMDFRTLVGEGPATNAPATCGGPCSKPTQPSRTDISMFFELGLHWGH